MNVDEMVKNECLKTYDDVYEKIKLLTPLMNKMKDNKNNIDKNDMSTIKIQFDLIHHKCLGLVYILWGYLDVDKRIKETNEAYEKD